MKRLTEKNKKIGLTFIVSALLLIIVSIVGLSIFNAVNVNAEGEPAHHKSIDSNGDGTHKLSLDVTGEAIKKAQKANVIVVFDTSSSMNSSTGNQTISYTPTNSTGGTFYQNDLYGLIDGNYVQLSRTSTGSWYNPTYHFWYNNTEYTGQRYTRQNANQSRLAAAKEATNSLASALLAHNGNGNPNDTIEIALVDFANTAEIAQTPTTDYDTFAAKVNSRNAGNNDRGTNWEAGFRTALNVDFGSNDNDPTYVIFVSDGNPTFYLQDPQNTQRGGSGQEDNNNINTSYNQAVPAAKAVVDAKYNLYTIGIYGNVDRMENITTAAGTTKDHYFAAADTAALQAAFAEILEKIEMSGIGNARIEDGTTEAIKIETTDTHGMLVVDTNSFTYTVTLPIEENGKVKINTQEATLNGNTITWGNGKSVTGKVEGNNFVYNWTEANDLTTIAPPAAQDKNGKIIWDLKELGVLINNATYTVSVDVWPSQETYDLVADLKNGTKKYEDLDENITKYLSKDYILETNTGASLFYTDTRTTEGEKETFYNNPPDIGTATDKISIEKKFEEGIIDDAYNKIKEIKVNVQRDGENFYPAILKPGHWKETDINISTGLMRTKTTTEGEVTTTTVEVLEKGHDYKFAELDEEAYNWQLETQTIHPMLINNELTELILIDEVTQDKYTVPSEMDDTNVMYATGTDGKAYYRLEKGSKKVYVVGTKSPNVEAINHRRSHLNISKIVDSTDAPKTDTFDITITVNDTGLTTNEKIWFSVWDNGYVNFGNLSGWEKEITDDQDKMIDETGWTGFYKAPSGTPVTLSLKQGQNVRFTNLTNKATYTIVEADKDDYEYITTTANVTAKEGAAGTQFTPAGTNVNKETKTVTGKIDKTNSSYTVNIVNKYEKTNVTVTKEWTNDNEDGIQPDEVQAKLLYADGTEVEGAATATLNEDNEWTYTWTGLTKYDGENEIQYKVEEIITDYISAHYETEVTPETGKKFTITNKRKTEDKTIEASVKKIWDDANNQDGKRPTSIDVLLEKVTSATNEEGITTTTETLVGTVTLNEANGWTSKIENLPKYENGTEIEYKWVEKDLSKEYKLTNTTTDDYTVTNTQI